MTALSFPFPSSLETRQTPTSSSSSRSPKRVKQTPTTSSSSSTSVYSSGNQSRQKSRIPTAKRVILDEEMQYSGRHFATSPVKSPDDDWGRSSRRREMSVPLLSQTLSHFSLSHKSPPFEGSRQALHRSTPPIMTQMDEGTDRHPMKTPTKSHNALPRDHVYPSTAPLPQLPAFLGSPFSSRTSRQYDYQQSPSKVAGVAMTERIPQNEGMDYWMRGWEDGSWDNSKARESTCSSIDESSGSGTSSGSLKSLGRSSGDHARVTIWNDEGIESDEDPTTPCRPFADKDKENSPNLSPSVQRGSRTPLTTTTPSLNLVPSRSSASSIKTQMPSPSSAKPRSPLASLIPRLLSSTKKSMLEMRSKSRSPRKPVEEELTDTEDDVIVSIALGSPKPKDLKEFGLGIQAPPSIFSRSSTPLTNNNSFSSESSIDLESPSKRFSIVAPPENRMIRKIPSIQIRRKTTSGTTVVGGGKLRPPLRRGVTEPRVQRQFSTPTGLFNDERPSPAAFASTGLVKKRGGSNGVEIPRFGQNASLSNADVDSPIPVSKSDDLELGKGPKVLPKSRGLRRKGSTVFGTSSGSIEGISEVGSPATPTKPGFRITTPSPTTYPFASSPSSGSEKTSLPMRLLNDRKPIARASNPMLAATFKAQAQTQPQTQIQTDTFAERFERDYFIVQSLGGGAFSKVWKVRDKPTGKLWAVKAGKPYTGYKNRLRQFEEASILELLSFHPNLITFVDAWETSARLYIRTSLCDCGNLGIFLEGLGDFGGLDEGRVWKVLDELSSGLKWIHGKGVLHLDLKPSNVMIGEDGGLQIGDFGLSRLSDDEGNAVDGLSPAIPVVVDGMLSWEEVARGLMPEGVISGVPSPILEREHEGDREYLCPEALSNRIVGRGADVFSLGILILEAALNVVLPSNGDGWVKLRNDDFTDTTEHYQPRTSRSRPTESGIPIISKTLWTVIKGMMLSDPKRRMTLKEVEALGVMRRLGMVKKNTNIKNGSGIGGSGRKGRSGPALVEEGQWFLPFILGE